MLRLKQQKDAAAAAAAAASTAAAAAAPPIDLAGAQDGATASTEPKKISLLGGAYLS